MNCIIEANKFLNDEKLGLYFSNEKKDAVVKFAVWLFENAAQQGLHQTAIAELDDGGFPRGGMDQYGVLP